MMLLLVKRLPKCKRKFKIFKRCTSIWSTVEKGPPDPNLGITEAFYECKNPKKVNLGVGTYLNEEGKRFVFNSVRQAEKHIFSTNINKMVLPSLGNENFRKLTLQLSFGTDCQKVAEGKVAVCQSIAGTGALTIGALLLQRFYPGVKKVFLPDPTWINHEKIMLNSGLEVGKYRYYNPETKGLDFKGLMEDISNMPDTAIILLQVSAHNPTGIDPTNQQWDEMSPLIKKKNLLPFFDMAYQGFGTGNIEEDAYPVRKFLADDHYLLLAQSFSKNLALYGERVGSMAVVTESKDETNRVMSQFKYIIRSWYSSPPLHGANIVTKVLQDPVLRADWINEFKKMAHRINHLRSLLTRKLQTDGTTTNWDYMANQRGMYCFTGLSADQVQKLADNYGIFLTKYGRLSIAGLGETTIDYVAEAIKEVTRAEKPK